MRKPNEITVLTKRIETLAKKEFRTITGQLEAILAVYEKTTGVTSKRPYTRKELATTKGKPPRKVRCDKGVRRGEYAKRPTVVMNGKLKAARQKLASAGLNR